MKAKIVKLLAITMSVAMLSSMFLGVTSVAAKVTFKSSKATMLKKTASNKAKKLVKIAKNKQVTPISLKNGFLKATYKSKTGFITVKDLKFSGKYQAKLTKKATVYKAASSKSKKIKSLKKGAKITIVSLSKGYIKLVSPNGYIDAKYVSATFKDNAKPTPIQALKPNLYIKGDFESGIIGGCYSNNLGMKLSNAENHTPNGKTSWEIRSGQYQHLELLVKGNTKYMVTFWAKAKVPTSISLCPVRKPDVEKNESAVVELPHDVNIKGDNKWKKYSVIVTTPENPYPGPESELLFKTFSGSTWFIDDIEVCEIEGVNDCDKPLTTQNLAKNPTLDTSLENWFKRYNSTFANNVSMTNEFLTDAGNGTKGIKVCANNNFVDDATATGVTITDITGLTGKKIRVSIDCKFLDDKNIWVPENMMDSDGLLNPNAINGPGYSGILFTIRGGAFANDKLLCNKIMPWVGGNTSSNIWYTYGKSAGNNVYKTIYAEYTVPDGVTHLYFSFEGLPGMGTNYAVLDNFAVQVVE